MATCVEGLWRPECSSVEALGYGDLNAARAWRPWVMATSMQQGRGGPGLWRPECSKGVEALGYGDLNAARAWRPWVMATSMQQGRGGPGLW